MATDLEQIKGFLSQPEPKRWVFAGDSITHGALHTFGWRDYSELFSERLRYEMGRGRECIIKTAISGYRITDIAADLDWNILQHRPNVVSINVGMNDCSDGAAGLEKFATIYHEVLKRVRQETSAAIILHTPQYIQPLDEKRYANLPAYVEAVRKLAHTAGAVLVDHDLEWRDAMKRGVMAYWLSDPIHPNEIGHRVMTRAFMRKLDVWDDASFIGRLFIA
jgi:lysophospholipase L1-like esterase